MNYRILLLVFFVCPLQMSAQAPAELFDKLQKMAGTWGMETSKGKLYEHWAVLSETEMSGISYRMNGNDTIVLERVRVIRDHDNILYIPVVTGQNNGKPVVFTLVSSKEGNFVFENKTHDYPQRVMYKVETGDKLFAKIEGVREGKIVSSDFPYSRVK